MADRASANSAIDSSGAGRVAACDDGRVVGSREGSAIRSNGISASLPGRVEAPAASSAASPTGPRGGDLSFDDDDDDDERLAQPVPDATTTTNSASAMPAAAPRQPAATAGAGAGVR